MFPLGLLLLVLGACSILTSMLTLSGGGPNAFRGQVEGLFGCLGFVLVILGAFLLGVSVL